MVMEWIQMVLDTRWEAEESETSNVARGGMVQIDKDLQNNFWGGGSPGHLLTHTYLSSAR